MALKMKVSIGNSNSAKEAKKDIIVPTYSNATQSTEKKSEVDEVLSMCKSAYKSHMEMNTAIDFVVMRIKKIFFDKLKDQGASIDCIETIGYVDSLLFNKFENAFKDAMSKSYHERHAEEISSLLKGMIEDTLSIIDYKDTDVKDIYEIIDRVQEVL